MDYRRVLFQLEPWSPALARKFWAWRAFLDVPLATALGLRVNALTDLNVEVELSMTPLNKNENGEIRQTALVAAGEFAAKILWRRHLDPRTDELRLASIHCRFNLPVKGKVKLRAQLNEVERERVLRQLRSEKQAQCEVPVLFFDERDRQIASLSALWQLNSAIGSTALQQGRENS